MYVNRVSQNDGAVFGAYIVRTPYIWEMESRFIRHGEAAKAKLFQKIEQAIEKHPSDMYIFSGQTLRYGQKEFILGHIYNSNYNNYVGKTANSNGSKALASAWKEFLNPENSERFNLVLGKEHAHEYNGWWDKYIKPIWGEIQALF